MFKSIWSFYLDINSSKLVLEILPLFYKWKSFKHVCLFFQIHSDVPLRWRTISCVVLGCEEKNNPRSITFRVLSCFMIKINCYQYLYAHSRILLLGEVSTNKELMSLSFNRLRQLCLELINEYHDLLLIYGEKYRDICVLKKCHFHYHNTVSFVTVYFQ